MFVGLALPTALNTQGPHCCLSSSGKQGRLFSDCPRLRSDSRWGVMEGVAGLCQRLSLGACQPISGDAGFVAPSSHLSPAQVQRWLYELE